MQFVDKHDYVALLANKVYGAFKFLFQRSAVFGARNQRSHIQRKYRFALQKLRHVAFHDGAGKPFDHGAFAYARLADEHGIVFGLSAQNLNNPLDFFLSADDGIQLVFAGAFGQIYSQITKLGGQFTVLAFLGRTLRCVFAVDILFEFGNQLVLIDAEIPENGGSRAGRIHQKTVQYLFGPDDFAAEFKREPFGVDQRIGGARRKSYSAKRNSRFVDKIPLEITGVYAVFTQKFSCGTLFVYGKSVQNMFGSYRRIAVRTCNVFRFDKHLFCIFRIR